MRALLVVAAANLVACPSSPPSPSPYDPPAGSAGSAVAGVASAGRPASDASSGAPSPSGSGVAPLTSAAAVSLLAARMKTMREVCGEGHPEALPAALEIALDVGPEGFVRGVEVTQSKGGPVVASCAKLQVRAWQFPPSKAGVKYKFPVSY